MNNYLPCENPRCASYGKPHPNCKCYGVSMAEGGQVEAPDFIPDSPDSAVSGGSEAPDFIHDEHADPAPDFIPDDQATGDKSSLTPSIWNHIDKPEVEARTGRQALGDIESVGRGIAGPFSTGAELGLSALGVPGLSAEDIKSREADDPVRHGLLEAATSVLSIAGGIGLPGAIAKGAETAAAITNLGKIGSQAISGMINFGGLNAANSTTKALLGQGDSTHPVAMVLTDGLAGSALGLFGGGASGIAGAGINKIASAVKGEKIGALFAGIGTALKDDPETLALADEYLKSGRGNKLAFQTGQNLWRSLTYGAPLEETWRGYHDDGIPGAFTKGLTALGLDYAVNKAGKYIAPALIKTMQSVPEGTSLKNIAPHIVDYAVKTARGEMKMDNLIDGLFKTGAMKVPDIDFVKKQRNKIDDWITKGALVPHFHQEMHDNLQQKNTPQYAKGGIIEHSAHNEDPSDKMNGLTDGHQAVATVYPEQNVMLQAAKGRISNYLQSLKPMNNQPKLAFDSEPDQKEKTKVYLRALDVASMPLSVLHEIHKGTITPEHVKHFKSMYPEIDQVLQQKITERITKEQMDRKKPPSSKIRQGLSLLMGTPLSGEFSPTNMQAIQAVFQMNSQQQSPPSENNSKKSKSPNKNSLSKMSQDSTTSEQARIVRQQRPS